MGHCHCRMCRKFHGAAFATFGEVQADNFRWLSGETLLQQYKAGNGSTRQFCRNCGSSLTFESAVSDGSVIEFSLATLDTPIEERPDAHIFTAYKANWYDITDTLPRFYDGRNSPEIDNE